MGDDSALLRRVEWYGWVFTGLLTIGAMMARYPLVASGCAIGGALSMLHFKGLAMFLSAIIDQQRRPYSRIKKIALGAYLAKYLIIIGVVSLLFKYGVVEPVGLLGGLSVIFVAICVAGLVRSNQIRGPQK
jgi:ATP synthase I subunit